MVGSRPRAATSACAAARPCRRCERHRDRTSREHAGLAAPDPFDRIADKLAAPTLTEDERRRIELAILAAEARLALDAVSPLLALLPEPARSVVRILERIIQAL